MRSRRLFRSWQTWATLSSVVLSTHLFGVVATSSAQTFNPPNRGAPSSATDGGTRGGTFVAPNRGAPSSATDGGTRGDFVAPRRGAPNSATDGGTRESFTPPRRGAPETANDGGSRLPDSLSQLRLLVPPTGLSLTLSERPEFYAYVPASHAKAVKFSLYRHDLATGQDTELIHEFEQAAPAQSGIMSFALPQDYGLQEGELYHWYVSLVFDSRDPAANIAVDAWMQRLDPQDPIAQKVEGIDPGVNPAAYAAAGLWYEPLHQYAQARRVSQGNAFSGKSGGENWQRLIEAQCNRPTEPWFTLLNSVQLCEVAPAPFVN